MLIKYHYVMTEVQFVPPHPCPLPWGEGERFGSVRACHRLVTDCQISNWLGCTGCSFQIRAKLVIKRMIKESARGRAQSKTSRTKHDAGSTAGSWANPVRTL